MAEPRSSNDIEVFGAAPRFHVVRADDRDLRPWMMEGKLCPLLAQHKIAHVGIMEAGRPFEIIRNNQGGTFMLACFSGEGLVLSEGRWTRIRSGEACLQPPFVANAIKVDGPDIWKFAWVRYHEDREQLPILSSNSPVSGKFHAEPLRSAIIGLHEEASAGASPSAMHHWTELIHHYVVSFAQPHRGDSRLWRVWQAVEADLKHPWTLHELAGIACVSEEHLRRISKKELGRSPMKHLTYLRFQRAMRLLSDTDDKIEVIAHEVGFENPFTFSNTFKQWFGWRPSEHRGRKPSATS
ncbi:AraC-like DNA-binding protein [Haloferula luteola]|uniref:AraC-like DNA-binding protein n=1 Tax=Haloferula luteola TaxID=595692 RepID=A0A840UYM3_9BACT|nr:helix-turn-helix transcriptional regulator [Haloferula luteola]MBB5349926.1 AraC-like DNA-binding protein [Haloferula luteola]